MRAFIRLIIILINNETRTKHINCVVCLEWNGSQIDPNEETYKTIVENGSRVFLQRGGSRCRIGSRRSSEVAFRRTRLRGLCALQVVERNWEVRLSKNNRLQIFYVGKGDWSVKLWMWNQTFKSDVHVFFPFFYLKVRLINMLHSAWLCHSLSYIAFLQFSSTWLIKRRYLTGISLKCPENETSAGHFDRHHFFLAETLSQIWRRLQHASPQISIYSSSQRANYRKSKWKWVADALTHNQLH